MTTPMQQQYNELKEQHKDAILLFRLGDFYEAFNDDAKILSKVLGITLTGRGKGENKIPMAGIPYHSLDNYLHKLVSAGHKVAMAEQLTEAGQGTIVERGVVKIHTPGTYTDEKNLSEQKHHYIGTLYIHSNRNGEDYYLSLLDISIGELFVFHFESIEQIYNAILTHSPAELLLPESLKNSNLSIPNIRKEYIQEDDFDTQRAYEVLTRHFNTKNLKGFGFEDNDKALIPLSVVLRYAADNQKTDLEHVQAMRKIAHSDSMQLDFATIRNLELVSNLRPEQGALSLYDVLNDCKTSMGQRLLRQWILTPLTKKELIEERQEATSYFYSQKELLSNVIDHLGNILDIERLVAKIGTGSIHGRDLLGLQQSLEQVKMLTTTLSNFPTNTLLNSLTLGPDNYEHIIDLITKGINEECPVKFDKGGVINDGFNEEIDELRKIQSKGEEYLLDLQTRERKATGIDSLKVKFNKVFGYYIEVTKTHSDKVPEHYVRKQTLVNAERFITPELKEYEEKILHAEDRLLILEREVFAEIVTTIAKDIPVIQALGKFVAHIDVFANFASIALSNNYTQPEITEAKGIHLTKSRHPVVEKIRGHQYIPNNSELGDKNSRLILLTGPNMSGKSTYIRQIALITLMAQIGSYVPAETARIGVVDRIFTRVGASDSLASGESTFMVEMNETSNILNNATEHSLVILDEVGRGTSTYDGVAIAWSIVKYIDQHIKCLTLFATHYHELIELEDTLESVKNYHVHVDDSDTDEIIFTHEIKPGGMDQSYGIHVAELAGIPKQVIQDAKDILGELESNQNDPNNVGNKNFYSAQNNPNSPRPKRALDKKIDESKQMGLL